MIEQHEDNDLRERLSHVLWLGGSTCAGKTSVAQSLADRYGLTAYHFDRREPFHIYRSVPERQPGLIAFMAMTMDQRWVLRSPEEMVRGTIDTWGNERFPMVVDDLLALPQDHPIVAEGPGLFPACVAPLLSNSCQAIWLVAVPDLIRSVRSTRPSSIAANTSDPPGALQNLIDRDVLLAAYVREQAEGLGLNHLEVGAPRSLAEVETLVEQHFAPLLRGDG